MTMEKFTAYFTATIGWTFILWQCLTTENSINLLVASIYSVLLVGLVVFVWVTSGDLLERFKENDPLEERVNELLIRVRSQLEDHGK